MSKIAEAIQILTELGLPHAQQNERSALTLLALLNIKPATPWAEAKERIIGIHDILIFISEQYQKQYAENTRETIRRQTIHQFQYRTLLKKQEKMRNSAQMQRKSTHPALRAPLPRGDFLANSPLGRGLRGGFGCRLPIIRK